MGGQNRGGRNRGNQDRENDEVDGPRLTQDVDYIDIPERGSALLHL